jgi:DNA-directed RNA polymerase specialized sigma24 family protein
VMGIKETTLRVRMNRIKDKLRELTKEEEAYEYR